ncbi:DUF3718 domain-containing protein [Pseudoalteromonas piscicida]|uniref:DUF3718 domain-containing protein n=1 Tax=Pseudoalteromonas piscicida TaxID=43662 RepID=A0A2A5JQ90_PSEO7|nr:DUF3718 domain-containing protein [Pseudoalteromonas piscicida]PCK31560.1 hypothetical protein CEX98_11965 [Pseudoalteromonas piscicida]
MKLTTVLLSVTIAVAAFSFSKPASANEQLALSLCEYIAADDKNRIRKALKTARLKMRNIYDGIQCNGNNLLRHAIASNANDSGEYIIKSIPKSALEDGKDLAWAESNHAGSALIAVIKDRAGL